MVTGDTTRAALTVTQSTAPEISQEARKEANQEDDHKKEKSVLQAKLTKLAIQIGYAGKFQCVQSSFSCLVMLQLNCNF